VRVRFAVRVATPRAAAAVSSNLSARLAPRSATASQAFAQFAAVGLVSITDAGSITLSATYTTAPPPPGPPPAPEAKLRVSPLMQVAYVTLVLLPACCIAQCVVRRRRARKLRALQREARAQMEWVYQMKPPKEVAPSESEFYTPAVVTAASLPPSRARSGTSVAPLAPVAASPAAFLGLPLAAPAWLWGGAIAEEEEEAAAAQPPSRAPSRALSAALSQARSAAESGVPSRAASASRFSGEQELPAAPAPRRKRHTKKYHIKGFKDLDPNLL
jgi:hypothetical protein